MQKLYKADVHIHSCYSDGRPSVKEILDYVQNYTDLDVISISDHDTLEGAYEAKKIMAAGNYRFELILGEEITSQDGHILGLFLQNEIPGGLNAEETVKAIHAQGGVAISAHPFERSSWNNKDLPIMHGIGFGTLLQLNNKLDGLEVINATPFLGNENYRASLMNKTFIFQAEIGSSDAHIVQAIGQGYTLFEKDNNLANISLSAQLKNAILLHQTRAMHNKWTLLALLKYLFFFMPKGLRILWNTILHGRTKIIK